MSLTFAHKEHLRKLGLKWGFLERKQSDYNTDTLVRVRRLAATGWPHGAIASMLGWDLHRLRTFCERHHVTFTPIVAVSRTPDPKKAGIRWDGKYAWHGKQSVLLPPVEGRILKAILKGYSNGHDPDWTMEKMAQAAEIPKKSVSAHMSMLRSNLEHIGLTLTRRSYELSRL